MTFIQLLFALGSVPNAALSSLDTFKNGDVINNITSEIGISKLEMLFNKLINAGVGLGGRIIAATIIFVIGRFVIKIVNKVINKVLTRNSIDPGIRSFLKSLINALMLILLIIAVVNKLGIETTSFAALLASFGVAIGMAMSGNLSNFVGGIIILMFRPYKVGDWIEVNGILGQVTAIEIFHTILRTYSGTSVYCSNGNMSTSTIKNYCKSDNLRVDIKVSVEYNEDLKRVDKQLLKLAAEDARVLTSPEPTVVLDKLADSSVDVVLRMWVARGDYWGVKNDVTRRIYDSFNELGISFPFPQMTIHQAPSN